MSTLGRRPFLAMAGAVIAAPARVVVGAPVPLIAHRFDCNGPPCFCGAIGWKPRFDADVSRALRECYSMSLDEGIARLLTSIDGMVDALGNIGPQMTTAPFAMKGDAMKRRDQCRDPF